MVRAHAFNARNRTSLRECIDRIDDIPGDIGSEKAKRKALMALLDHVDVRIKNAYVDVIIRCAAEADRQTTP